MKISDKSLGRLRAELIMWMTTVTSKGRPQPSPVWFWWDESEILVYSLAGTARTANIGANPKVALNLNTNATGGDVLVVSGLARIDLSYRPATAHPEYAAKYQHLIDSYGWTVASFAADYSVPILVTPSRIR